MKKTKSAQLSSAYMFVVSFKRKERDLFHKDRGKWVQRNCEMPNSFSNESSGSVTSQMYSIDDVLGLKSQSKDRLQSKCMSNRHIIGDALTV